MSDDRQGDQAFRKEDDTGRWPEMTYGGALSFLRRRYTRDLRGVDVAVTGLPYDGATTFRPGARLGPRAVRAASVQLAELPAFPFGFDPFDHLSVVDYGDCMLDPGHPDVIAATIQEHVAGILAEGTFCLSLGGDHFVSYPCLRAHAAVHGPLALIQFDAHGDTWPDDGNRLDHGTMFLRALREGAIDADRSIQVGIRTANPDAPPELAVVTAPEVHRMADGELLKRIVEHVGDAPAYVTFDVDCLDPAFAPGTGTPVVGGLSSSQALELVRGLLPVNMVGADVVEVAPAYDHAEITALAAATVAHDLLCVLAQRRQR